MFSASPAARRRCSRPSISRGVGERYSTDKAIEYLKSGKVVMFGCGTGCPFFSTDTAAVLRAAEIGADAILLAKNIDGVYSAGPKVDPSAVKYDSIATTMSLRSIFAVMDSTATSALPWITIYPVIVFALAGLKTLSACFRAKSSARL